MTFEEVLQFWNRDGRVRINLHDLSGRFADGPLRLPRSLIIHEQPFCDTAKATKGGYRLCTTCKLTVCKMALRRKAPFFGTCPYGLCELVYPIFDGDRPLCILFVGNCVEDRTTSRAKAEASCAKQGADPTPLLPFFDSPALLPDADRAYMLDAARLTESYLRLLLPTLPPPAAEKPSIHWVVRRMAEYAEENFRSEVTLGELSRLYARNEVYLGQLFHRQMGLSFHAYLGDLRLRCAARLLQSTDESVLSIALDSGFGSISYFNRSFAARFGMSPTAYRRQAKTMQKVSQIPCNTGRDML